jgi:Antitoxin VbhA
MNNTVDSTVTPRARWYRIRPMSRGPKDTRSPAQKARDTAGIVGSMVHEGYVPTPETEAIHQRAERGEITTEELVEIFRQRALKIEAEQRARKRSERV